MRLQCQFIRASLASRANEKRLSEVGSWPLSAGVLVLSAASNLLALVLPLALLQVYDRILPSAEYGTAISLFGAVSLAIVMDGVLRMARTRATARAAILSETRESLATARGLLAAPLPRLAATDPGARRGVFDALARAHDAAGVSVRVAWFDLPFAAVFLMLVWFIGGLLVLLPLAILLLGAGLGLLLARQQRAASLARARAEEASRTQMADLLAGLTDLKGFGYAGRLMGEVEGRLRRQARATEQIERASSLMTDLLQAASVAATLAITLLGALLVVRGEMTTGGLAACSLLGGRAVASGLGVFSAVSRRGLAEAAAGQVEALRAALGPPAPVLAGPAEPGVLLRIEGLGDAPVRIGAGHMLRVLGNEEAAGRFLRAVLAGAPDRIERAGPAILVPAGPVLFRGTILDNLTGWDPSRAERAVALARAFGLSPLVDVLQEGMRTPVGSTLRSELSAGMLKRIALVRALASDAPLLLLEYPERDLDAEGRQRLVAQLAGLERAILIATDDPALAALSSGEIAAPLSWPAAA
jgi:ABC-type bacteriocin/lantibiotic exporter with double-glycine peptidase domain